jgi:hypothetical protein
MESIGFACKKKYGKFSRFRTFYALKTILERKTNFRLSRRYLSRLKVYRFEISATFRQLDWMDAPHTQNF